MKSLKNTLNESMVNENNISLEQVKGFCLNSKTNNFVSITGHKKNIGDWKVSVQGETIDDLLKIVELTYDKLVSKGLTFKYGTKKLIEKNNTEQSTKFLTIYVPDNVTAKKIASWVAGLLVSYRGGDKFTSKRSYEMVVNGIFIRNDRDENGNYIKA